MSIFFAVRLPPRRKASSSMRADGYALLVALLLLLTCGVTAGFAQDAYPWTGAVTAGANLRSGPGTSYARVGSAVAGQSVTVVGANEDGSWYRLQNDQWIAAFLVERRQVGPSSQAGPPPGTTVARVSRIVDGDTIDVLINDQTFRLRYILMNTPESGQPFAAEATEKNRELVSGKTVYLEKDVSETDRYGRLLRYVYLADGTMVNRELVRLGFAQLSTYPPDVKHEAQIRAAQQEAVAAKRGLWATTGPTANANANLRSGPGTNYPIVGSTSTGGTLEIVGRNQAGDWYQLRSGAWIAAFLVDGATSVPVAQNVPSAPSPTPQPVAPAVSVPVQAAPAVRANCDPHYPTVCIPSPPPDLDCGEIPSRRFQVVGGDPHRFDGDHDGIGCESR